jgi:hypothetical protein
MVAVSLYAHKPLYMEIEPCMYCKGNILDMTNYLNGLLSRKEEVRDHWDSLHTSREHGKKEP